MEDLANSEKVAIKMIPIPKAHDSQLNEYIKREIELLKSLKHPNIITFVKNFTSQNNVYLVMEYCQHGDLQNYLDNYFYNKTLGLSVLSEPIC
jgi:serine/threonine protein kinase